MELKLNHRYLVRTQIVDLTELICIEVTKSSCKVKYENGNTSWFTKDEISYWREVEDLGTSKFLNDNSVPKGN
jgi:hypothetical protein